MTKLKKFDLIFSIGEACSCSEILRINKLQEYSYPFDWLFGSNFIGRCNIMASHFENFIEKKDLEYSYEEISIKCSAYHNKNNDITFNHDFLKEMLFDDAYEIVKEKYKRRINRLLNKISRSKSVLVVYLETPTANHNVITNEEIIKGYSILEETFGDKVNLLYLRNDDKNNLTEFLENGKITKISMYYKDCNSDFDYVVDIEKLKIIFSKYKLNLPYSYIVLKIIIKILINFLPIQLKRHILRKKNQA